MEKHVEQEVLRFAEALCGNRVISGFLEAKDDFDTDGELVVLRDEFAALMKRFQEKQFDGTLTQEDIAALRAAQSKVNTHPVTTRFVSARNEAMAVLRDCNTAMSELLGIDFAAAAAPAGSCCG